MSGTPPGERQTPRYTTPQPPGRRAQGLEVEFTDIDYIELDF